MSYPSLATPEPIVVILRNTFQPPDRTLEAAIAAAAFGELVASHIAYAAARALGVSRLAAVIGHTLDEQEKVQLDALVVAVTATSSHETVAAESCGFELAALAIVLLTTPPQTWALYVQTLCVSRYSAGHYADLARIAGAVHAAKAMRGTPSNFAAANPKSVGDAYTESKLAVRQQ